MKIRSLLRVSLLALLALGVAVAGAVEITVTVPPSKVSVIEDAQGVARFSGENILFASLGGEPAIPYHVIKVLLPPFTDLATVSISLTQQSMTELPGEWDVSPMPALATWPTGSLQAIEYPVRLRFRKSVL